MLRRALLLMLAVGAGSGGPALAQQAVKPVPKPVASDPAAATAPDRAAPTAAGGLLTLDPVALYEGSDWFKRVQETLGSESAALNAENDRLAADLADQERSLTERRAEMAPEEFRAQAAAFDAKVVQTRRDQEEKAQRLTAMAEAERAAFFRAAIPVFAEVMAAHEAVVILDRQSVFISAEAVDVTDELLKGANARLGPGTAQQLPPDGASADGTEAPAADTPQKATETAPGAAPAANPPAAPVTPGN